MPCKSQVASGFLLSITSPLLRWFYNVDCKSPSQSLDQASKAVEPAEVGRKVQIPHPSLKIMQMAYIRPEFGL